MRGVALIGLLAFAACQAQPPPPPISDGFARATDCRAYRDHGCRVAGLRGVHVHTSHRRHVKKAAWHRAAPSPTRRDVNAILDGMRRARSERHVAETPANSSP